MYIVRIFLRAVKDIRHLQVERQMVQPATFDGNIEIQIN